MENSKKSKCDNVSCIAVFPFTVVYFNYSSQFFPLRSACLRPVHEAVFVCTIAKRQVEAGWAKGHLGYQMAILLSVYGLGTTGQSGVTEIDID